MTAVEMRAAAVLSTLALLAHMCSAAPCWVDKATFGSYSNGHAYSVQDIDNDFRNAAGPFKMLEGGDVGDPLTQVEGGALRAEYPAGTILGTSSGFSFYDIAPKASEQAWMKYRLYFSPGFDWTRGGKLPGLCGGPVEGDGKSCPTGCSKVESGDGFSLRLMWRRGGSIVTYAYYPDKPKSIRCGEDWLWDAEIESGRWYDIAIMVQLNTVSDSGDVSADGVVQAWLDDKMVLDMDGLVLRRDNDVQVTRTYLTTYVGGSSVDLFAPDHDQYALFDNFSSGSGTDVGKCETDEGVSDQSLGGPCGDLDQACCYVAARTGGTLCGYGSCKAPVRSASAKNATDVPPCLCSNAVCIRNLDYCPDGTVCDQSGTVPPCGSLKQPCCNGDTCDEEVVVGGDVVALVCELGACVPYA